MNQKIRCLLPTIAAILALLVLSPADAYTQEKPSLPELIPEDGRFEGWSLKDSVRVYDPDFLYVHVGEVSGLYEEYGTVQSAEAVYMDPGAVRILLEVFEMRRPEGAWGIFTMNSSGKGNGVEVGDVAMQYDHFIHFVRGNYYVRCTSSNREESYMQYVTGFCNWVADKIEGHAKMPAVMKAFDFVDITTDREKYFMGQTGLNEVFDFGHGTFAGFSDGASCRSDDRLFIVLAYADERKRREWFASARGKVKMSQNQRFTDYRMEEEGFTALDRNGNMFVFKPYGKYVFITRGFNWREALGIMDEMESNLGGDVR